MGLEGGWCGGYQETEGYMMFLGGYEVMIRCIDGVKVALKVFW